jgi:hypothetical protein
MTEHNDKPTLVEALVGIRATGVINMLCKTDIEAMLRQQADAYDDEHYLYLADELHDMRGAAFLMALHAVGNFQHAKRVIIDSEPESILA